MDRETSTRIGVGALYVFAASAWVSTALANVALGICLLAFLMQIPGEWPRIRGEPMFMLVGIAGIYLLFNTLWAMVQQPQLASQQPGAALNWFILWLFVVTAWWCAGNHRRIGTVLYLTLASFFISLLIDFDWAHWQALLINGPETGIGFTAAAAGLYTTVALLGLLLLAAPWNMGLKSRSALIIGFLSWILIFTILVERVIVAKSRTTWVALIIVSGYLAAYTLSTTKLKRLSKKQIYEIIICSSIIVFIASSLIFINSTEIQRRFDLEPAVAKQIILMDWSDIPYNSLGERFYFHQYGLRKFIERPILGWGPGTAVTRAYVADDGFPKLAGYSDLHDGFLVLFVRLGIIGGLIYLVGGFHLCRRVLQAYKNGFMTRPMFLFLSGSAGITFLSSLMNFRWIHNDFRFFWLLLAGVAFSYVLRKSETLELT